MSTDNEYYRFGSAEFAELDDLRRAGMLDQKPNSLFVGFKDGKPLWYSGMGGALIGAGARSGKLTCLAAFNACISICSHNQCFLDLKGEIAAISQNQTDDKKHCIYWNPCGLHRLPMHRINPVDYIRIDSPSLVADVKIFCQNIVTRSNAASAVYFEDRSRQYLEGIVLGVVERDEVLTLSALMQVLNNLPANNAKWLDFAFLMSESRFDSVRSIEEDIASSRVDTGGGFKGIMGELLKSFAALSDPALLASVSPPYDFSFSQLCEGDQNYNVYLMPPAENVEGWKQVIKSMFVAGMIYKARAPQAEQQTWILDEVAQLGAFPLIMQLFTYGAGIGIRPVAIFQSLDQMNALGRDAKNIISSSAALKCFFAVRDIDSAQAVSNMLGSQTLLYQDEQQQAQIKQAQKQTLFDAMNGDDLFASAMQYAQLKQNAELPTKQHRPLRTPAEILNMPPDRMFVFSDALQKPIYADRQPYYETRFMAGRYHPNPYHPPLDSVKVKSFLGSKTRPVIRERVPAQFAGYPQYADGYWSRVG